MELLDLFDLVIVINAPHRTDRRREMREALARIGWNPDQPKIVWFPAIDPRSANGFTTPGARGAFLSHIAVCNLASHRNCQRVLILEDDCDFGPDFAHRQAEVAQRLQSEPWGIAFLGHAEPDAGAPGLRALPSDRELLLLHCYAVSADVLPRVAAYLEAITLRPVGSPEGGPMSIDGAVSWFRRANPDVQSKLLLPSLAHQRSSRSDLRPNWYDRIPILRTLIGWTRSMRR